MDENVFDRESRETTTRDSEKGRQHGKDHQLYLTLHPKKEEYRWIRTSALGQSDMTNVSSKFREGWEPVKLEDHPELKILPDVDSKFKGNVEVEDCYFVRTPKKTWMPEGTSTKPSIFTDAGC